MTFGQVHQLFGDPGVVGFHQTQLTQAVFAVGVEPRRDEDHLRCKSVELGQPLCHHGFTCHGPLCVGRQGHVDHVLAQGHVTAVRVERALKKARHEDAFIARNDVFGAVAVVHVKVDDGNTFQAMHFQRVARRHHHAVEKTKAHGGLTGGVVAGRADGAKGIAGTTRDHVVGGRNRCTRSTHHCTPSAGAR